MVLQTIFFFGGGDRLSSNHDPPISTSRVAGITIMNHHALPRNSGFDPELNTDLIFQGLKKMIK
jgi:hypothetical protein